MLAKSAIAMCNIISEVSVSPETSENGNSAQGNNANGNNMNVIKDMRLMGPFQIFINEIQMTNGSNLNRASVVLMCPPHSISY